MRLTSVGEILLFSAGIRLTLGLTLPPMQWLTLAVFPRRKGNYTPPPSAKVESGGGVPPSLSKSSWRVV